MSAPDMPQRKSNSRSIHDDASHAVAHRRRGVNIGRSSPCSQRLCVSLFLVVVFASSARADIFEWEYVDPSDPSQGKRQSTTLAPDGAGVDAVPDIDLSNRNLTMAYLNGADLSTGLSFVFPFGSNLAGTNLSRADLTNANFEGATLTGVDLTDAEVRGTSFGKYVYTCGYFQVRFSGLNGRRFGTGITLAQLYSTASYQGHDLTGVRFGRNDLAGGNFAGQTLTDSDFFEADLAGANFSDAKLLNASFTAARLTGALLNDANLTNANLKGAVLTDANLADANMMGAEILQARFDSTTSSGFTATQLYSTASYQTRTLNGISLSNNDLSGWNFAGQNLVSANFDGATLTNADLTGANIHGRAAEDFRDSVRGASFAATTSGGFTAAQLYSTASYQAGNLNSINLSGNDLSGWKFAGQSLIAASLYRSNLSQANLTNADLRGALLDDANLSRAEVRGTSFSRRWDAFYATFFGGISQSQLYSTAGYQARDLTGIGLSSNNLSGWNFRGQNLTNANFNGATMTNADFSGAEVRGANFDRNDRASGIRYPVGTGITLAQLYSTASYQAKDLSGIVLWQNDLTGGNFAGHKLSHANFNAATLTGADLSNADLTNARFFAANLTGADFTGAHVRGAVFVVRDWFGGTPGTGITLAQLYSTASYQAQDLSGIALSDHNLTGGIFAGQDLTNASFLGATLTNVDFSNSQIQGANFAIDTHRGRGTGITLGQLYSTASYQARDLSDIDLSVNDLSGGNFAAQNLTNATFNATTLAGTDFTSADLRGAVIDSTGTITKNMIGPDGHISGLDLAFARLLAVRDEDVGSLYDSNAPPIAITVDEHFTMRAGSTLRMVFEADAWDSTISFAPGIPVALGGTLQLTFADDVNLTGQVGRTFDLFDWTGVTPTGTFAVSSPYAWDLSNLYTTGEVTLIERPRACQYRLVISVAFGLLLFRRGKIG